MVEKNRKLIMALIAMILMTSSTVFALLMFQKIVPNTGIIIVVQPPPPPATIGLETFSDAAGTIKLTSINWGNLYPGDTGHQTIYLQNTGNTAGIITMAPGNWNPAKTQNITKLTWNLEGATLGAGQIIKANLTLEVSGSAAGVTEFAFTIVFTIEG